MKGSTGANTSTIIYIKRKRRKKAKLCSCKKCKHARVVDNVANCTITGEVAVNKRTCQYYYKSKVS